MGVIETIHDCEPDCWPERRQIWLVAPVGRQLRRTCLFLGLFLKHDGCAWRCGAISTCMHTCMRARARACCFCQRDKVKSGYYCIFIIHVFPSENLMNESLPLSPSSIAVLTFSHFLSFPRDRGAPAASRVYIHRERSPVGPPAEPGLGN